MVVGVDVKLHVDVGKLLCDIGNATRVQAEFPFTLCMSKRQLCCQSVLRIGGGDGQHVVGHLPMEVVENG